MSGSVRSAVVRLTADVSGLIAGYGKAEAATKSLARSGITWAEQHRKSLDTVGSAAGKFGLVSAAALGVVEVASANFDQAMSHVQAATHETAGNMAELRAAAIQAGQDTAFSASEAAGGIEELAKAGVSTKDVLGGGLKGALDLAAAGGLDVASSAEIAASALTQFHLSGKDVPHVADLLAAAAGKAQGSVTDMGYALKYAGVPAASLGVSIEQTTGVLAEFASAGIVGEQAGTNLRSILLSLAAPTHLASKEMKKYGLDLYDAQGHFVGLSAAAQQLHDKLGDATEAERNHALEVIFGRNAIQGAITLYNGGASAVDKWTHKVNDSGYAAQTASIRMDNLKGDVERLKGSLETAFINTGASSQGPLRSLVQDLDGVVNKYNDLPGPLHDATAGTLGFVAAAGGSVWAVSKLASAAVSAKSTMSDLGGSLGSANKAMLATRGAALAGGLALEGLGHAIGDSHHGLGVLSEAAGGAALGFSVGGPWGAAIGGGISLLGSLAGAAGNAAGEEAALTATLNAQTGAITGNTRQWVAHKLETDGVLANAQQLGLNLGSVTKAAFGNADAMAYLNRVLAESKSAAAGKGGTSPEYQRVKAVQALISALENESNQVDKVVASRKREIQASRTAQSVMQDLSQTYQLTPKQVRTVIAQENMGQSQAAIRALLHSYGLTPHQVQTFLKAIDQASPVLNKVRSNLNGLDGTHADTYIVTHYSKTYGGLAGGGGHEAPTLAAGGHVRGPKSPNTDRAPSWLTTPALEATA